jgi:putative tryptophan/tyrosine transport system substrate-binding protein
MQVDRLRRRDFITLLGGAAATAWPVGVRAQQSTRIAKIGHIESGWPSSSPNLLAAFRQGLRELGYIEGETFFIERRYAEGREDRLPQLAAELVQFGVDVIFAIGPPQALAASRATDRIPIVFVGGGDPVAMGLVKSLARPGGNLTGLTFVTVELASKRIQLLKDAVPIAKRDRLAIRLADDCDHLLFRETRFAHCSLRIGSQSLTSFVVRNPWGRSPLPGLGFAMEAL